MGPVIFSRFCRSSIWMRDLLDDFRRQSWAMKLFVLWGWLTVVIMVSSFITTVMQAP